MDQPALSSSSDDGAPSGPAISITGRVFDTLKRQIVELQHKPGDSLSEAEVARQLGVSRQPVREAFIKLAEVGLVQVRPKRGTFVRLISQREVDNARFVREAIEVAVVRKAAASAGPDRLNQLAGLIEAQDETARAGHLSAFLDLDDRFHRTIAEAVDCEYAWSIVEDLKVQFDRVRFLSLPGATRLHTLVEQHRAIVAGIAANDPDAAEAAMRVHLAEVLISLPKIAAEHAELFAD